MSTLVQSPPCPQCKADKPDLAYRIGWYRILDCPTCGTAFSHPRMDPSLAARFFSDRRSVVIPPNLRRVEDLAGTAFDRSRELSWVTRHVSKGRLLDVGCAWGFATAQARALGFDALGCELSRPLARVARERFGIEVYERDVTTLPLDPQSFDAILAVHVLEHLSEPDTFLELCWKALRSGGVLAGAVPNFDAYLRELLGRRWRWLDPESQPYHFRPRTLGAALERLGFHVELWTSEGQYGDETALEHVSEAELRELSRKGRGSEVGFVAVKRPLH